MCVFNMRWEVKPICYYTILYFHIQCTLLRTVTSLFSLRLEPDKSPVGRVLYCTLHCTDKLLFGRVLYCTLHCTDKSPVGRVLYCTLHCTDKLSVGRVPSFTCPASLQQHCTLLVSTAVQCTVLYLYCDQRRDILCNIAWARGKSQRVRPRDCPWAQAIFHRFPASSHNKDIFIYLTMDLLLQ